MTRRQFRPMSLGQECANLTNQETHADSTYEQYIDERTDAKFEHRQQADHAARQADADKAAQDTAAASAQAVLAENSTRMGEFEAQHPTFTETLKASQSPMTPVMEETMMRSTIGRPWRCSWPSTPRRRPGSHRSRTPSRRRLKSYDSKRTPTWSRAKLAIRRIRTAVKIGCRSWRTRMPCP